MICEDDKLSSPPIVENQEVETYKFPHGDHHEKKRCEHQADEGTDLG